MVLFARAREAAGAGRLQLEVEDGASPEDVFGRISRESAELRGMRPNLRCAIDEEYSDWTARLHDGAELAFIPPTAGG